MTKEKRQVGFLQNYTHAENDLIKQVKKSSREQVKLFANHKLDAWDYHLEYTKNVYKSVIKKGNNSSENGQRSKLSKYFSREDTQMSNEYRNKCSTSLSIWET